jgi:septum formation protein
MQKDNQMRSSPSGIKKLLLASQSPRRRELLTKAGYEFKVFPPSDDAEDDHRAGETPLELVARLARQKAEDVVRRRSDFFGIVIGCDTVVECNGRIFGKPEDAADARRILSSLSGREHRVLSGLCLWPTPDGKPITKTAVTTLQMDLLTPAQLDAYMTGGEWAGKAGAFGYQDGLDWVHITHGSESNVVGLPLELLSEMLAETASDMASNMASNMASGGR